MNVLLLSEHYYPKVGGTVSYVENTAINLAKKGVQVYLLVPAVGKIGSIIEVSHQSEKFTLLKVGVNENKLLFNAAERDILCNWVKDNILEKSKQYNIQLVHLLFGLFLAENINTQELKKNGIKTINTIHNVPPFECSSSWKGDTPINYYKDEIRKIGVRYINKNRIQKNEFDMYITPSKIVKEELSKYIYPKEKIKVIGHGGAEYILATNKTLSKNSKIQILTVGGIVPHKNQHLITAIAAHLKKENIDFIWNIVGPARNQRYVDSIKLAIVDLKLSNTIFLHNNATDEELSDFYNKANMYVQLSSEEGFCLTVLDAIAYGIPTLGTPAGAIPEMLALVKGTIIENHLPTLKPIITHYCRILDSLTMNLELLNKFKSTYTWPTAATQLLNIYNG